MNIRFRLPGSSRLVQLFLVFLILFVIGGIYMLTLSKDRQLAGCGKNIQAVQRFYKYKIDTNQNTRIKEYLDKLKLQKEQMEKEAQDKAGAEKKKAEEEKAKEQAALQKAQQAAAASSASASKAVPVVPVPAKTASVPALIDTLPLGSSSQAILILGSTASSQYTKCEVYEKEDAKWSKKWTFDSVVGRKGMNANKHEGDMTTPMGIYGFLFQFGSAPNPGVKMEYRQTSPGDLWTSNPDNVDEYNTWIHYDGQDPASRFYSYENLYTTSLYKYAAALDYNYGPGKVIGKGSAIFMHISPYTGKGTSGCIGLPEGDLLKVLKWMDPDKKPRIVIGTEQYLRGLK